jgi:SAM-dependent methyltransferase
MVPFLCNVCGQSNRHPGAPLDRERPSCSVCGSNVRTRALLQALSMELFGVNLALPDFPRVRSIRGIGTSDPNQYASRLAEKLDYRNTFFNREPRFDIMNPAEEEIGKYDFLISSEVFEHVIAPVDLAFRNVHGLLKPSGVAVFTVPYSMEESMLEHFPDLHQFGFAQVGDRVVLINRTRQGEIQVFENPVFHRGWDGPALEMREFTERDLRAMLAAAGFQDIHIYSEDYPPFGIFHAEAWSLPFAARKGPFALSFDSTRDVVLEWRDLKLKFNAEMEHLGRSLWFRVGRKLGLL